MLKVFPVHRVLRDVVTLQGHVVRPGEYQFNPGMKLTDLIPNVEALLPDVFLGAAQITRLMPPEYHPEVVSIDLGKALAGDPRENIQLKEQDIIHIYPRDEMEEKKTVAITGEVVNPRTVDYFPNMTVRDLIAKSGSLKSTAVTDKAELTRIIMTGGVARASRVEINLAKAMAGDQVDNVVLQPHDSLIVRRVEDWLEATDRFVTLQGEVRYPGTYSISKGEKLSSVIERAGGYTDKAYLKGAKFLRKSVRENQQQRMDEIIARTEQDVAQKQVELAAVASSKEELEATKAALQSMSSSLQRLKTAKAEGRVVMKLDTLDTLKNSPYDLELQGSDLLEVPLRPSVVNVFGKVYSPATLVYLPKNTVNHYLQKAGGPTQDAEEDDMYIIKADGSTTSRQQFSFWSFGGFLSTPLDPGDSVVVPQKLERIAWMREIKDIATILGQVALTAGVLIAAGL